MAAHLKAVGEGTLSGPPGAFLAPAEARHMEQEELCPVNLLTGLTPSV